MDENVKIVLSLSL